MTIDDIVKTFVMQKFPLNRFDNTLFNSLYTQLIFNQGFTEKQANLVIKVLHKYASSYKKITSIDILPFLANPTYTIPIRKNQTSKKITICDHTDWIKAIKIEFPYDDAMVEEMRKVKSHKHIKGFYSGAEKSWYFALNEAAIEFVEQFNDKFSFEIDEHFENLIKQKKNIIDSFEKFVPILSKKENTYKIENIDYKFPEFNFETPLEAAFAARKMGIFTWDEEIDQYLNSNDVDKLTLMFLKSDPGEKFAVNGEEHDFYEFKNIINYLNPCLIVIPGGSELEHISFVYNFLKQIGIKNKEISTMFRLPSESGKDFNDYVKINQINSPISEKTKVVFISSKLPKPIIESQIKFHTLINLGIGGVHYTIREFVANHENIIFFVKNNNQREMNFEFM